jgi:phosphopantothenoylcysteine decarboxylase/phosphopantothenate--cysteine ligase
MQAVTVERSSSADIVIKAAAVADYRPGQRAEQKLKKKEAALTLGLVKNDDILAELGRMKHEGQILIGFAAETENLQTNAAGKCAEKNLDMIVANDVSAPGAGFNVTTNIVRFVYGDGRCEELPLLPKEQVAEEIVARVLQLRRSKG